MKKIILGLAFAVLTIAAQAQTTPSQDSLRKLNGDTTRVRQSKPMNSPRDSSYRGKPSRIDSTRIDDRNPDIMKNKKDSVK